MRGWAAQAGKFAERKLGVPPGAGTGTNRSGRAPALHAAGLYALEMEAHRAASEFAKAAQAGEQDRALQLLPGLTAPRVLEKGARDCPGRKWRYPPCVASNRFRYVQRVIGHRFDDIAPRHTIRAIRYPAQLIHGMEDDMVPVRETQRIYANHPGERGRLLLVPGGHDDYGELDQPVGRIIEFLDEVFRSGRREADTSFQ